MNLIFINKDFKSLVGVKQDAHDNYTSIFIENLLCECFMNYLLWFVNVGVGSGENKVNKGNLEVIQAETSKR